MTTCGKGLRAWGAALMLALSMACGEADPVLFVVTGQVVDERGRALAGAVVTDGVVSTLTSEEGRFRLAARRAELAVTKPAYGVLRWAAESGAQPLRVLKARPGSPAVAFDRRGHGTGFTELERVSGAWGGLQPWPGTPLSRLDVLLLMTPQGWSAGEVRQVLRWVHAGGRLVVCGEWAGYPGLDLDTVEGLSGPAGITFTGGTLKVPSVEAFTFHVPSPEWPSLAERVGGAPITLFGASELALRGEARALLSAKRGYVVLASGAEPVLAGVGPYGSGKVFVFGDSSLWRDEDSSDAGQSNLALGGNRRLLEALLVW